MIIVWLILLLIMIHTLPEIPRLIHYVQETALQLNKVRTNLVVLSLQVSQENVSIICTQHIICAVQSWTKPKILEENSHWSM